MSRRRFASSVLLALLAASATTAAEGQAPPGEAEVKAAFVYNFLKFVEWPPESFGGPDSPLVVGVVGEGGTADATERFLASRQVGTHPIAVRRVAWNQSLAGVHALFVAESDDARLRRIFAATSGAAVLSIGEGAGFASTGGVIGLVIEERKVRFDIDMGVARASGLKVSSKLLALTRVVRNPRVGTEGRR